MVLRGRSSGGEEAAAGGSHPCRHPVLGAPPRRILWAWGSRLYPHGESGVSGHRELPRQRSVIVSHPIPKHNHDGGDMRQNVGVWRM
jgi:hypothetical protein